ncbi:DUF2927 domain-containing protein [Shimia thalassica]|uniref:DUF2927 domain-containing protein n=1 Tax=Shimia thalassica TaxID=1715693 RepID=UPI0027322C97|nr:DUF2927 domain-containing protein [Shimia thalassica]MDP2493589.1 DUF2927 domain-containing protein [Shimia thalassica]
MKWISWFDVPFLKIVLSGALINLSTILGAVFLMLFSASTQAEEATYESIGGSALSREELDLVHRFEQISGEQFPQFFSSAVHQREYCVEIGNSCHFSLQKRVSKVHFVLKGAKNFPSDEEAKVAGGALIQALSDVSNVTGLQFDFNNPNGSDTFIYFLFVDTDEYFANPEVYVRSWVARDGFNNRERQFDWFSEFMRSTTPCMALTSKHDDNIIRDSYVWIKNNIGPFSLERCVAEELFNSLGLDEGVGVDSIFDWPLVAQTQAKGLHDLHLLMLKLLYSVEFEVGQTQSQTTNRTSRLLGSSE